MKQILIIHGGSSFASYHDYIDYMQTMPLDYERLKHSQKWKPWIAEEMIDADVLLPAFPNGANAIFDEWKLYFEKILPFLEDDVQLVGHSLGAMFLGKYLQHCPLAKPVRRVILIAGRYTDIAYDAGSFELTDVSRLSESADEVHLFHSQDDKVVPYTDLAKFQADLPGAISHTFTNRGHFNDATFPELLKLLKQK
ncbi:hypothetical protein GII36_03960 [Candidatus Mycosynbacter amalyticus]|uniref:Serine hydrolase family protein n=1 Tax=Candidatus Mycosynbacter amalyticus TaxID=2665156 RepID=A0A857MP12_9BACT|nr:alpha/beta hydrolase [Candidatus Mycosynbacter amalyticus]QHN42989.1 hypothetical protein GII36_03960 [Candidatus Mycosynbacter amalyticus]